MQEKDAIIQAFIRKNISLASDRFKNYIYDENGNQYYQRFAYIRFNKYIRDFLSGQTANRFVIVSGLRGTGKTTIVAQMYNDLLKLGVSQSHMLYISMDEVSGMIGCSLAEIIQGYEQFLTKNLETLQRDDRVFLFIDEIHYDPNWSLTLKSIFDKTRNVFMFVTGSSAISLTTGTDVARRAKVETLFPLNYLEYNLLKERLLPPSGIKEIVGNAILNSSNAKEAFERLKEKQTIITEYLSKVKPMQQNEYLKYGTLPFAIPFKNEQDVYERILSMLEKVVFQDLESIGKFNRDTQMKIMNLLTILASSDRVNYDKLSSTLGMSKPTLSESIDALEKADLIFKIWPHGSTAVHIRKTPKYKFTAPAVRTSLLWNIGSWKDTHEMYGSLLEDVVAMYLHRFDLLKNTFGVEFDSDENCADFILTLRDNSNIVIEVGYGHKGANQIHNSAAHCNLKYGVIVSNDPLELKENDNILIVPKEIFLLS
jgi:uncharacterized protein